VTQATIHQAKTHLSKLIRKALDGEEVIIANRDKPLVRLEVMIDRRNAGRIGGLKHWKTREAVGLDGPKLNRGIERDFYRVDKQDPLLGKQK
jgi:antitoxin (DNA-binding transcriptional repressor) of toxin-antitoxin stability system